jgi:hypothetical protein
VSEKPIFDIHGQIVPNCPRKIQEISGKGPRRINPLSRTLLPRFNL